MRDERGVGGGLEVDEEALGRGLEGICLISDAGLSVLSFNCDSEGAVDGGGLGEVVEGRVFDEDRLSLNIPGFATSPTGVHDFQPSSRNVAPTFHLGVGATIPGVGGCG